MSESKSQIKLGIILSYVQMILSTIVGLIYTPIMIRELGQSEYGLYNTVSSTISLLSILNLGFNSSYIRYYSKYKKENDEEAIAKLNGLFLLIFIVIGSIALACGLFLSFNLKLVFDEGLTASEYSIAKILMLLLTVNLSLSFPFSVFTNIINAHERFVFLKLLGMVKTVIGPFITLPILFMGYGSVGLVVFNVSYFVLVDVLHLVYVKVKLKQKFMFKNFEKGLFKSLFVYTGFIAIGIVVDQINWNIDKMLLGRYKGTIAVAVYSIGYTLFSYYISISSTVSTVFTPRVHSITNNTAENLVEQKKQLTELFVKVGRVQFLILGLFASGLVMFGKPFINFWAGAGYEESYYVMILLVLPCSIALIQNVGIEIQRAQNKHKFRSIIYLAMAVLNLGLSIFMCQKYGAIGCAVGTAVSLIVANGLIMNVYYHKKCNVNVLTFWKNILFMTLGLLIPSAFGALIVYFVDLYVLWKLVLSIAIYSIVYCISVYFISMNEDEKNIVKKIFRKLKR